MLLNLIKQIKMKIMEWQSLWLKNKNKIQFKIKICLKAC